MKTFKTLLLLSVCAFLFSCGDDNDVEDPADTITLNMLNEQNGKTFLGKSDVYINKANNFFTTLNFIADAGKAKGIGVEIEPLLNKLTKEVAVTPGNVYQIFDARTIQEFPSGSKAVQIQAGYYQAYVVSPITNNNSNTGAIIKYVMTYPDKQGLPQLEKVVGKLNDEWNTIEIGIPRNAEYFLTQHYGSVEEGEFYISKTNSKLIIGLDKKPDKIHGPYGDYQLYIRSGNVYTVVIVKVGM